MLKRKEGHIVCVSSVQGKFSLPHRSAYSASKHAMQAFCDSLRAEVAEHNVKVLCVSPGYINTALSLNALTGSGRSYGSKISFKLSIFLSKKSYFSINFELFLLFSVTDATTASGASPESVADDIRKAILSDKRDVILAPILPQAVHWIRFLLPSIYFWVMEKRARKMAKNKDE